MVNIRRLGLVTLLLFSPACTEENKPEILGTLGCNLAPNSAFEITRGTDAPGGPLSQWNFLGAGKNDRISLSQYPEPVQSGAVAARFEIGSAAEQVRFVSERLPAVANAKYRFAARIRSPSNSRMKLAVAEWPAEGKGSVQVLKVVSNSDKWVTETVEFTTANETKEFQVRFLFSEEQGTFLIDDPLVYRSGSGDKCYDLRHYVTQSTPGFKKCLCKAKEGACRHRADNVCTDSRLGPNHTWEEYTYRFGWDGEPVPQDPNGPSSGNNIYRSSAGRSKQFLTALGDLDISESEKEGNSGWRCFTGANRGCGKPPTASQPGVPNIDFGPLEVPLQARIPSVVLSHGPFHAGLPTGAALLHDWKKYGVRAYDPETGMDGKIMGEAFRRAFIYVIPQMDLDSLGTLKDVVVVHGEGLAGFDPRGLGVNGGTRVEKYYFVQGYGLVAQMGSEDRNRNKPENTIHPEDCHPSNPSACDGNYSVESWQGNRFGEIHEGDFYNDSPQIRGWNQNWW